MIDRRLYVISISGAVLLAVALSFFLLTRDNAPSRRVAVVPARWIYPDPGGLDPADERAAEAIAASIAGRGRIYVIAWSSIVPFRQQHKTAAAIAKKTGATLILAVSVRRSGRASRVTVSLLEPFTGRKRWAEDLYAQDLRAPGGAQGLADAVAKDLEVTLGIPGSGE